MSTIAAAAQTADRIDYWIRRHVIQYCYGTHPLSKPRQVNSARDRRVGLLANWAMPEGPVRRPCDPHAPASRCTRQPTRNAEIERQMSRWIE